MSTRDDDRTLNHILSRVNRRVRRAHPPLPNTLIIEEDDDARPDDFSRGLQQWTSSDGKKFVPASKTIFRLLPGAYEIKQSQSVGVYFEKIEVKTEGLVRFPDTNSDAVIDEITKFWEREDLFAEFGLTYKRGICLWGPQGSGKTSAVQFVMKDVIQRGGVVLKFTHPVLFINGLRILREIQADTPVVVLMEDIDSILETYSESEVLNILDGIDQVNRTLFLATTNYPEELGARIINRPSRFDKRFFIGYPRPEARLAYFRHLLKGTKVFDSADAADRYVDERARALGVDLDRWTGETEDFSIAHLKELFVAVVIQGDDLDEAIQTLRSMKDKIQGDRDPKADHDGFGF